MERNPYMDSLREALQLRFNVASSNLVPSEWIAENTFLKGKKYSFMGHEYQIALANDKHRTVATKKCAQIGFSEILMRLTLCFLVQHQGSQAIYTLPTDRDVSTFTKSRVDPTFDECPVVQKLGTGGVDSTQLKRIGLSFLNMRGTFGTRAAISVPSDLNVHDEVNFSNPRVRNQFKSRLQHSEYKLERAISTPTIPGYGVSELYDVSDQKIVMHKCPACGRRQTTEWPDSVTINGRPLGAEGEVDPDVMDYFADAPWDRKVEITCSACAVPLTRSWTNGLAEWVATYPERAQDEDTGVSGYQISQMDVPFVAPSDIVKASDKRFSEGYKKKEDFYNFVLGRDYAGGEGQKIDDAVKVVATIIMEGAKAARGAFLGVDLGNECHVVVIKDLYVRGELKPVVIAAFRISKAELEARLPKEMANFGHKFTVSDAQPYTTTVEKIARSAGIEGSMAIAFFGGKRAYSMSPQSVQVTANKTQMLDAVTEEMPAGGLMVASGIEDYDLYWKHCKNLVKVKSEDDDGEVYYEYVKVSGGEDHYGLATGYAMLARRIFFDMKGLEQSSSVPPGISGMKTNL